jgi:magnesium transporter
MVEPHQDAWGVPLLRSLLSFRDFKAIRSLLKEQELADIAEVLSELNVSECLGVLRLVPRQDRATVFSHIDHDRQKTLVSTLPDLIMIPLLNDMEPDDRTALLEDIEDELRDRILLKLSPEEREVASQLLSFPEDSVGRMMTPDFMTLKADMSVSQALKYIHWNTSLPAEFLHHLFVTEDSGMLLGEVSLGSLVICDPPNLLVSDVMGKNHVNLSPYDDAYRAVELFRKYDHLYIPVIDNERKMIGIVTSDDVFDLAEEEATEDIQQFGGHAALEDSYFATPVFTMFRKRAGALAVLFVGGFLTSEAMQAYNDILAHWSFLAFFVPLIIASGGNSGTQAASLIIRGLAINEFEGSDTLDIFKKELLIGVILGLFLTLLWCIRAYITDISLPVSIAVGISIIFTVIFGVVSGAMLPFLFRVLRLDPAVVSSPFISTLVDVTGILIFLNVAILVFRYFGVA